uniref:Uncharacterized protein n=1 Tax=Rhizophora mucronata TaxID=61149 RepID=A0A2P2N3H3_RHIMU
MKPRCDQGQFLKPQVSKQTRHETAGPNQEQRKNKGTLKTAFKAAKQHQLMKE